MIQDTSYASDFSCTFKKRLARTLRITQQFMVHSSLRERVPAVPGSVAIPTAEITILLYRYASGVVEDLVL